ncbi:DUF3786 domain-containing protein [Chloroflexota bacterium]
MPTKKASEYGYGLAYQLALKNLAGIDNIELQCLKAGAQYADSPKGIRIDYLNQPYLISLPDGEVSSLAGDETIPIRDKLLILHYFIQAKGTPISNNLITYKELQEGILYFPVFYKRAIKPFVNHFGDEPHRLLDIAGIMGGHKADYGDVAVTIDAFRHVPITLVLWKGDEEFNTEGNLMFDSTVSDYLTNDDLHVLCETIAWKLVKLLKMGGDNPGNN